MTHLCNLVHYFHLKSFIPFHIFFFLIKIIFSCSCIMDIILYIYVVVFQIISYEIIPLI